VLLTVGFAPARHGQCRTGLRYDAGEFGAVLFVSAALPIGLATTRGQKGTFPRERVAAGVAVALIAFVVLAIVIFFLTACTD
jgi:hypothetical protein